MVDHPAPHAHGPEMEAPNKRPRLAEPDGAMAAALSRQARNQAVYETDVGVEEYLSPELPAFHAVIKQRFSDFVVREITLEGQVCRLTADDLLPPPGPLRQRLERELAEFQNPELVQERLAKEQTEREAQNSEAQSFLDERAWPADAPARLAADGWSDQEIQQIHELWLAGPLKPGDAPASSVETASGAQPAGEEQTKDNTPGGSDKGNAQSKGNGKKNKNQRKPPKGPVDNRVVLCHTYMNREMRTAAHTTIRALFQEHLTSTSVDAHQAKKIDPEMDLEEALLNAPADNGNVPQPFLTVRWNKGKVDRRRFTSTEELAELQAHPPFITFLMQKTNRELYDAAGILTRNLGMQHKMGTITPALAFAGTKDKRGVTTQAITFKRGKKTLDDVYLTLNRIVSPQHSRAGQAGRDSAGRPTFYKKKGRGPSDDWDKDRSSLLDALTKRAPNAVRIGRLSYTHQELRLGALQGNEFVITLRNVSRAKASEPGATADPANSASPSGDAPANPELERLIDQAIQSLGNQGCINYFGLQRFGTTNVSTHAIGVLVFKGDYKGAVDMIMADRITDNPATTQAREDFRQGRLQKAYYGFPRSYVGERAMIGRLIENERQERAHNWFYVLHAVARNLRIMYCHAYQSYVWNKCVSARLRRGREVMVGDYVLADRHASLTEENVGGADDEPPSVSEDEEANNPNAKKTDRPTLPAVKVLTEQDDLTQYTLTDVLMPMPGSEVRVPPNTWLHQELANIYAPDGLSQESMYSSDWKEYRMRGAYRYMVTRPRNVRGKLIRYTDPEVDLTVSDEDAALAELSKRGIKGPSKPPVDSEVAAKLAPPSPGQTQLATEGQGPFLALQLVFELPVSTYATMVLREVLKSDTSPEVQRLLTLRGADQKYRGMGQDAHLKVEVEPTEPTETTETKETKEPTETT